MKDVPRKGNYMFVQLNFCKVKTDSASHLTWSCDSLLMDPSIYGYGWKVCLSPFFELCTRTGQYRGKHEEGNVVKAASRPH